MKTLNRFLLFWVVFFTVACSKNTTALKEAARLDPASLINIGKIHNAGLTYFAKIPNFKTLTHPQIRAVVNNFTNDYFKRVNSPAAYLVNNNYNVSARDPELTIQSYLNNSPNDYSTPTINYLLEFEDAMRDSTFGNLSDSLINDTNLTKEEKYLLVGSLSILISSCDYWENEVFNDDQSPYFGAYDTWEYQGRLAPGPLDFIISIAVADMIGYLNELYYQMSHIPIWMLGESPEAIAAYNNYYNYAVQGAVTEAITQSIYYIIDVLG